MAIKICAVYKITSPSGGTYVGSSVDVLTRFRKYRGYNCGSQIRLYNSLKKYGHESHSFEILIECEASVVRQKEHEIGSMYNVLGESGLNCKLPQGSNVNITTEETRARMSVARIGKKPSLSTIEKMRAVSRLRTPEQREKISATISKSVQGIKKSKEHNRKVSEAVKRVVLNYETGIFYFGVAEAAESINIKRRTLSALLTGQNPNYTQLNYAQ